MRKCDVLKSIILIDSLHELHYSLRNETNIQNKLYTLPNSKQKILLTFFQKYKHLEMRIA